MSWQLPLIFTAWGFRHGGDKWRNADELADYCAKWGVRTVAVQLGSDESGQTNTTTEDAEALRAGGLHVAVWGVADSAFALKELQRLGATQDDWLPQVEGPSQRELVLAAATSGLRPAGIVTNYSGAGAEDSVDVDDLRGAGVRAVFVECYNDAGIIEPYIDLDRMLWQGTQYGWRDDELTATMGTYHGELPGDYSGVDSVGVRFGLYLAEPMSSTQWEAFGQLAEDALPIPEDDEDMEPVSDQQGRDGVMFAVQAAAQNWTQDKPKGRLSVCRRIVQAGNDDAKWNACRDDVLAALDRAGVPK